MQKTRFLSVFSPRDPENRVRGEILHILVVGELRGMVLKRFYETCAKIVFAKYSLHLQYLGGCMRVQKKGPGALGGGYPQYSRVNDSVNSISASNPFL